MTRNKSAAPQPTKLVGLTLTAQGQDPRTGVSYLIVRATGENGRSQDIPISFSELDERRDRILALAAQAGFRPPVNGNDRRDLLKALDQGDPERQVVVVTQPGWTDTVYCNPLVVIGTGKAEIITNFRALTGRQRFAVRKSLKDWQRNVAAPAAGNRILVFCLALAFAPPLLPLFGAETGGFQLVGPTSMGKSTAARLGGSVWGGGGNNGFCASWSTTANAIDETATAHRHALLVLDETGLTKAAGDAKAADLVLSVIYRLTSGERKARLTETELRDDWQLLYLSTSELTLPQLAAKGGQECMPGELVRLTDIMADGGKGMGVFEELHGAPDAGPFAEQLTEAAKAYYGSAGVAFLERLVRDRNETPEWLRDWLENRSSYYLEQAKDLIRGQHRVAKRFALVYAAGRLAARYDILPYSRAETLEAVRYCHAQAALGNLEMALRSAVDLVGAYIRQKRDSFLDLRQSARLAMEDLREATGLIHQCTTGGIEFLFPLETFRQQVCAGARASTVCAELRSAGLIHQTSEGKTTVLRKLPAPAGRQRVVSISGAILKAVT